MSMRSSGQQAYSKTEHVECMACDWHGELDVRYDPEINQYYWECPACTTIVDEPLN